MRRHVIAVLAAALLPLGALAQESAPPLPQDPRAPRFREVERGFFTGFEVGYLSLFKTPTADRNRFPLAGAGGGRSSGFVLGTTIGYDVTDRIALALFFLGGDTTASLSYGSFSVFAAGADVRVSFYGKSDSQGVDRLFLYVHGRGGYLRTYPEGLFGTSDAYLSGGPGVEYFTRLRHFSIGLAADYVRWLDAGANGYAIYPTVRYTF